MPATFFTLSSEDIFKQNSGQGQALISIPEVDKIIGEDGLAIYNHVSLQLGETIQYFLTFDDVIKFIHFGKGVGTLSVEGTLYSNCDGNIPGLSKYNAAFHELRGSEQKIDIGGIVITAIMTTSQVNITGDPDTMAQFNFTFSVVNHSL
jgi:hypothetical protein